MAYTLSDLSNLEAAIASGARRVKFEDREVEYRSLADLITARNMIRRQLGLIDPNASRTRASLDKDLG